MLNVFGYINVTWVVEVYRDFNDNLFTRLRRSAGGQVLSFKQYNDTAGAYPLLLSV